ncbi:MAG TPA: S1 RNA-binding domain-containing protein, partial [Candidatus Omnitrophota bacterium]|nr:S1 RNA-binding domain-containing protein [Candidatus Omnitrophota bacterium]
MDKEHQSLMSELYDKSVKMIKKGEIVRGQIVAFNDTEAVVDIGFKSEGFVSLDEFRNKEDIKIDNQIDVLVESIEDEDGRLVLSKIKAEKVKGWQKIMGGIEEGAVVDGRVIKVVKGGYMVDIEGLEAFLPMSLSAFKGYSP